MSKPAKSFFLIVLSFIAAVAIWNQFGGSGTFVGGTTVKRITISEMLKLSEEKQIESSEWQGSTVRAKSADGQLFETTAPEGQLASKLFDSLSQNAKLDYQGPPPSSIILSVLSVLALPLLILAMIYFLVIRPMHSGGNQALSFGKSRARRVGETTPKITFDDVAGIDEARQELYEIVDFLKNTKKYSALGARIPKGILLTGPPGVGKTHLARAIAGEAGVPFFHISGSDFVEMFVGVGAARVRDLFETAKAHRPSLVFMDEIDAVGRQRGAGLGGGHDEREQTLNQLLVEMDGFDPNSGVILIAATNRPDVLDPALLRPGRFDRQLVVDPPDAAGREAILKVHIRGKPLESDVDLNSLAKRTPGFTGADLANMLNEGALLAARRNRSKITQEDLEEALDRVIAGPQRKSKIISEKERKVIAYHEAGHAIVGELLENCDPVHKVTILPRGLSLGSTWSLPESDKYLVTKEELVDDITALLGGRVAEELTFNQVTTGASNDLQRVTQIARAMVCQYGMSEKLGTLAIGRRSHNPFLGRDYAMDERNYSEDVARMIDEEVREIVEACRSRAEDILRTHSEQLDAVVDSLLVHETLDREDFLAVMSGEEIAASKPRQGELPLKESEEPDAAGDASKSKTAITPPRLEPGAASG